MSYIKLFLKYGLQDNNWVGHSVMKPVDDMEFQKIRSMMEGNDYKRDNFEMEIIDEGAIDKALIVPENIYTKIIWKTIYEVIDDEHFKQSDD